MKTQIDPDYNQLKSMPLGEWIIVITAHSGANYLNMRGKDCMICLAEEPTNINRGTFHAKLEVFEGTRLNLDAFDGWECGRYYFDLERAKAEVEAWMNAWQQLDEEGDRDVSEN